MMFAESLLESNVHASSHRRKLATALSITMQALVLATLIAVSTLRPVEFLFAPRSLPTPLSLPRMTPIVPERVSRALSSTEAYSAPPVYMVPSPHAVTFPGAKVQPSVDPPLFPFDRVVPGANGGDPFAGVLTSGHTIGVKGPSRPFSVSRLSPGQLISRTEPRYPIIAKQAGIQGEVVLTAIISKGGSIESLQVKSGHPVLAEAALDAVRRWLYRPYILNGEAMEVETQITVDFKLGR